MKDFIYNRNMDESTPVSKYLSEHGIPHRLFRHPGQVHSLEQAALERGQRPEQVVRSIVFRLAEGEYVMVLMAGPGQISWPALRRYLGRSRITMASEGQVREVTGYPFGAVSPFGLPAPMRILIDKSVLNEEEVSIGSGVRNTTVFIKTADLLRALGEAEIGEWE